MLSPRRFPMSPSLVTVRFSSPAQFAPVSVYCIVFDSHVNHRIEYENWRDVTRTDSGSLARKFNTLSAAFIARSTWATLCLIIGPSTAPSEIFLAKWNCPSITNIYFQQGFWILNYSQRYQSSRLPGQKMRICAALLLAPEPRVSIVVASDHRSVSFSIGCFRNPPHFDLRAMLHIVCLEVQVPACSRLVIDTIILTYHNHRGNMTTAYSPLQKYTVRDPRKLCIMVKSSVCE
jgi:hypothetical protein